MSYLKNISSILRKSVRNGWISTNIHFPSTKYKITQTKNKKLILKLDEICFPDDTRDFLEYPNTVSWILREYPSNNTAGYSCAYIWEAEDEKSLVLSRAGILPEYRGKGLQRRLIRARLAYARYHKLDDVWTYTRTDNLASNNNLIKEGFVLWEPSHWGGKDDPKLGKYLYWRYGRALHTETM